MENKFNLSGKATIKTPNHDFKDAKIYVEQSPTRIMQRSEWEDGLIIEQELVAGTLNFRTNREIIKIDDNTFEVR